MAANIDALTEKEKQTLRLIARGHDAKSTARELSLSVHTINERLRDARRKLSVGSSREAARLLLDLESAPPQKSADEFLRDDVKVRPAHSSISAGSDGASTNRARPRVSWLIGGALLMLTILGLLALTNGQPSLPASMTSTASAATAQSPAETAARRFLELLDQSRWDEAFNSAGAAFRDPNTSEGFAAASREVRGTRGKLISRTLVSEDAVPAPPNGIHVVKYRSRFEKGPEAIETLSLAEEEGTWKVVGIYVE